MWISELKGLNETDSLVSKINILVSPSTYYFPRPNLQ